MPASATRKKGNEPLRPFRRAVLRGLGVISATTIDDCHFCLDRKHRK